MRTKLENLKEEAKWSMSKFCEYHHELATLLRWGKRVIKDAKNHIENPWALIDGYLNKESKKELGKIDKNRLKSLEKMMDKLEEFEKDHFRNEKTEDTYYHKKYCNIMRKMKKIEVKIDFTLYAKLEYIEAKLERLKIGWFENYYNVECKLWLIIEKLLDTHYKLERLEQRQRLELRQKKKQRVDERAEKSHRRFFDRDLTDKTCAVFPLTILRGSEQKIDFKGALNRRSIFREKSQEVDFKRALTESFFHRKVTGE